MAESRFEVGAEGRSEVGLMVKEEVQGTLASGIDFECRRTCNLV